MYSLHLADFDCNNCTWGRHCDHSNPAPFNQWMIENVTESNICLKPIVSSKSLSFLRYYQHYKNGVLPYSGGLFDQPYGFVKAMAIIEHYTRK